MSRLYVNESSASVGFRDNRVTVKFSDGLLKYVPIESLEGISIIGNATVSTQCIGACLERGIDLQYYSAFGSYFGKLTSTTHVNTARQKAQFYLTDDMEFRMKLARNILWAKIQNQCVIIRRYSRSLEEDMTADLQMMSYCMKKLDYCQTLDEMMGYEGTAAKSYFQALGKLVNVPDFQFTGRSRRPPRDAFNSMLSLGYSLLLSEIYGAIEGKGLSPYFGFIHADRLHHPALASDLMEEWRAVIVDSLVMSMVNGHEIAIGQFYTTADKPGVFLEKTGMRAFIQKIEKKMTTDHRYLAYVDYPVSFRRSIDLQVGELVKAIETHDATCYKPVLVR
jgi:CRISPR-associated protein Cas1